MLTLASQILERALGKKLLSVPALLAGGLALSACYAGNLSGPKVGVVGDSITAASQGFWCNCISNAIAPKYAYQISGVSGATMTDQFGTIEKIQHDPEGSPNDWIIELGTNNDDWGGKALDANWAFEFAPALDTNWAFEFDAEVAYLQHAGCVIFVTVGTDQSVLPGPMPVFLNAMMSQAAAQHPNMHVLDWGNIEYLEPSWLAPDHVHPTTAGAHELASLELQALQRDCG
jgi:GDSL-like Lipase/Acylhydrolase family